MYTEMITNKLNSLKESGQYREFVTINRISGQYPWAMLSGQQDEKRVVVWCSNDYLGMSQHPVVTEVMHDAIRLYGAGSGGSRNIGGTHYHYSLLESSLADWHKKEAALVFPTGYSSNDATLQCLLRLFPDCIVISDENDTTDFVMLGKEPEYGFPNLQEAIHLQKLLNKIDINKDKFYSVKYNRSDNRHLSTEQSGFGRLG